MRSTHAARVVARRTSSAWQVIWRAGTRFVACTVVWLTIGPSTVSLGADENSQPSPLDRHGAAHPQESPGRPAVERREGEGRIEGAPGGTLAARVLVAVVSSLMVVGIRWFVRATGALLGGVSGCSQRSAAPWSARMHTASAKNRIAAKWRHDP